jgi:hypothetical protein
MRLRNRRHSSLSPVRPSVTCASRGAVVVSSLVSSVYVRLRSLVFGSAFIGIRISAAMQVTDVNGIRRTINPTFENRKVGGSTLVWPPPVTLPAFSRITSRPGSTSAYTAACAPAQ